MLPSSLHPPPWVSPGSPVNTCTNTSCAPGSCAGRVSMSSSSSLTADWLAYTGACGEVRMVATRARELRRWVDGWVDEGMWKSAWGDGGF